METVHPVIHPVILCGGSGKRLWPLSRAAHPKQFAPLLDGQSMLSATLKRFNHPAFRPPMLLCAESARFLVGWDVAGAQVPNARIILEPTTRNTAAPVCAAACLLARTDPNALMLISPSDHIITDEPAFHAALKTAVKLAQTEDFITFGVKPTRAETDFGYIELTAPHSKNPQNFTRFIEKPDVKTAESMIASQKYLWNSGLFLMRAEFALNCFATHAPDTLAAVQTAIANAHEDADFLRLADDYKDAQHISFDYAIAENLRGANIPLNCGWNDLGNWNALWQTAIKDNRGLARDPDTVAIECRDSLIKSYGAEVQIIALGLEDTIAVAMGDAVLLARMDKLHLMKDAMGELKRRAPMHIPPLHPDGIRG